MEFYEVVAHGINTLLHSMVMVSKIYTPSGSLDPHSLRSWGPKIHSCKSQTPLQTMQQVIRLRIVEVSYPEFKMEVANLPESWVGWPPQSRVQDKSLNNK